MILDDLKAYVSEIQNPGTDVGAQTRFTQSFESAINDADTGKDNWELYIFEHCHPSRIAPNFIAPPNEVLVIGHMYGGEMDPKNELAYSTFADAVWCPSGEFLGFMQGSKYTPELTTFCKNVFGFTGNANCS